MNSDRITKAAGAILAKVPTGYGMTRDEAKTYAAAALAVQTQQGVEAGEVAELVVAAREFWQANEDMSEESRALDMALEAFAERVPYENEPEDVALAADAYVEAHGFEHSGGIIERAFEAGAEFARSTLVDVPAVESEPVAALQTVSQEDLQEALALLPSVMRPSMSARIIAAISEQADIIARFKRTSRARRLAFEAASSAHPPRSLSNEGHNVEDLTRPIIGFEHRTPQEVFDIMADRIRLALSTRKGSAGDGSAPTTKGISE